MMATGLFSRPEDEARAASSSRRLGARGFGGDVSNLIEALHADQVAVRAEAAFLLGFFGELAGKEALRKRLDDSSARVRVEAALALARLGDKEEAIPILRTELGGEFFQNAPLRAARALALLGEPTGYGRVMEAMASSFPSNRIEATAVIDAFLPYAGQLVEGKMVDPVAALVQAASDPEEILRRDALSALARTADPRAIPVIEAATQDRESAVQELARRLLAHSSARKVRDQTEASAVNPV